MKEIFERIEKHFYRRQYRNADGTWTTLYYARFVCRLKKKRRLIPLGSDSAKAREKLRKLEVQDIEFYDFDLDRERVTTKRDGKTDAFTFAEWADEYPKFDDVSRKRSLGTDLTLIRLHLKPFFGPMLLTDITREALNRYITARRSETLIRGKSGKSKKSVARGTISNELSLLRRMLKLALREEYKVAVPSFEDLIVRTKRGGRALTAEEQKNVLAAYDPWMRRLAEFATETCLSQGDILRLTDDMIHMTDNGPVIIPAGGRLKTQTTTEGEQTQIAPLTARARSILEEIRAERRKGIAVPNVKGLIFTNADGTPITKGQIQYQIERALKQTGIRKFVFHNYRNTALTEWARRGINVDVAMKASGHSSVEMHKRYIDLQAKDVATAFGTGSKMATEIATRKRSRRVSS